MRTDEPQTLGLDRKVAFLRSASAYAEGAHAVRAIETHMSWVFLTEDFAYKLKKPVRYSYLDFSSIEARRYYCHEEVRLNAPLADSVYLDAIPLTVHDDRLQIAGDGAIVDWLVKMRRLPETHLLDRVIAEGRAVPAALQAVAHRLSRFYRVTRRANWTPEQYTRRLERDIDANEQELNKTIYQLPSDIVAAVHAGQRRFLQRHTALVQTRVRDGHVIEAHGDLRPEHICLDPAVIIDRLDFNADLRLLDAADELAFLALECERLGAPPAIAGVFFDTYRALTGDAPPPHLILFYQAVRACLRAKIAAWHTTDPAVVEKTRWARLAHDYLARAGIYLQRLSDS
jgi:aminoglycoside phosphotransferase family enzyme